MRYVTLWGCCGAKSQIWTKSQRMLLYALHTEGVRKRSFPGGSGHVPLSFYIRAKKGERTADADREGKDAFKRARAAS